MSDKKVNLNNVITVSSLRTILSPDGNWDEKTDFIQAEYINGMYLITSNLMEYKTLINSKVKEIPIEIKSDIKRVFNHLIYRTKKEKLNPIEIAYLFEEIKQITGYNQKEMSQLLNKTQGNISNKRRLLKLPLFVQMSIINDELTERHGRALLQLTNNANSDKLIQRIYKEIIQKNLNVDQTEIIISKVLGKVKEKDNGDRNIQTLSDKRELSNKTAIPVINQLEGDLKNSFDLISRFYPEIDINLEEGIDDKDYVFKIEIKNVK